MKLFLKANLDALMVLVLMLCIFFYVVFYAVSDMSDHAYFARVMLSEGKLFSGNFLLYLLINLFSGFKGTIHTTKAALVLLLSVSNTTKYLIVKKAFEEWCNRRWAVVASLMLLFVFVVPVLFFLHSFGWAPYDTMYIGYYVPNVWHNSTILCMMPFAIVTYLLSVRQFESFDSKRNWLITLFVVLGTLVKPSFFFVYAVAYPICMFVRYRFHKEFFYSLIPVVVGCLCVVYEFATIFNEGDGNEVMIGVLPLFTVAFWKSRILYLAVSMALPLLFVLFYGKEAIKDMEFWFVLIMLIMALGISWCCYETGSRANHGNFSWQVIASMWFVYYYMLKTAIKTIFNNNGKQTLSIDMQTLTNKVFICLFGVHVAMGLIYLGRYLITGCYY